MPYKLTDDDQPDINNPWRGIIPPPKPRAQPKPDPKPEPQPVTRTFSGKFDVEAVFAQKPAIEKLIVHEADELNHNELAEELDKHYSVKSLELHYQCLSFDAYTTILNIKLRKKICRLDFYASVKTQYFDDINVVALARTPIGCEAPLNMVQQDSSEISSVGNIDFFPFILSPEAQLDNPVLLSELPSVGGTYRVPDCSAAYNFTEKLTEKISPLIRNREQALKEALGQLLTNSGEEGVLNIIMDYHKAAIIFSEANNDVPLNPKLEKLHTLASNIQLREERSDCRIA